MKVVILCGGLGTRLREETEYRPKPLVDIGGRPILRHIMKIYAHHAYRDFILCLGYRGYMIKEYFLNYDAMNNDFTIRLGAQNAITYHDLHQEQDFNVTLAETGLDTMTGARVKLIERYIEDDMFMLTYGDGAQMAELRAITAGIDRVTGDAVVTMDDDLQHPPEVIPELVKLWRSGYDVVNAVRQVLTGATLFKRAAARLYYRPINKLAVLP